MAGRRAGAAEVRPAQARAVDPGAARLRARRAVVVPAVRSSVAARAPSRVPALAVAQTALPELSARPVPALRQAAAYGARPRVEEAAASPDVGVPQVAALQDAAAVPAEAEPGVVAEVAPGVALAAAGLPAAPAVHPSALPSAGASRQGPVPLWPAPQRSTRPARAMGSSPIAWRSKLSWRAARVVVLSCAVGPGRVLMESVVEGVLNRWRETGSSKRPRSTNKRWAGLWRGSNGNVDLFEEPRRSRSRKCVRLKPAARPSSA